MKKAKQIVAPKLMDPVRVSPSLDSREAAKSRAGMKKLIAAYKAGKAVEVCRKRYFEPVVSLSELSGFGIFRLAPPKVTEVWIVQSPPDCNSEYYTAYAFVDKKTASSFRRKLGKLAELQHFVSSAHL